MKLLTQNDLPLHEGTAVAIGLFDGIHAGHTTLIHDIECQAGLKSLVYTFDTKPNHAAYKNIYTAGEKVSIFASMNVDMLYEQPFTKEFSQLTKEAFLQRIVKDMCAKHITVGFDFRFGRNAEGTAGYLQEQAGRFGYTVYVVPAIKSGAEKVSSTLIRGYIEHGEMERTASLLRRFYFIDGKIEKGRHLGSSIGFPTANISTDKLLPRYGVYATIVQIDGKCYPAVTNVGVKPTVSDAGVPNVETFIFNFSGDVYNERMRVNFVSFLRGERPFPNVAALQKQIAQDAHLAQEMLRDLEVYKEYILW
ncbi:bifunctional riboflavin kinase/FAD synthetase [Christensenella intestinihominis]|uniref:bifunctional riboflavin kinase/FAD synthetase n=1 Tax=Christensenella intestinihominis TaxID=1851429 RepID=UPI00082FE569|nr:bifunctional riboflavin kinase/FAD synthetase [Christensenella intestinihominis]